jgi:hypothetical protein
VHDAVASLLPRSVSTHSEIICNRRHPVTTDVHSRVGGHVVTIRVLAHSLTTNEREELQYDISIDPEMRQVLNTTKRFHFAPCSTSNLMISSYCR